MSILMHIENPSRSRAVRRRVLHVLAGVGMLAAGILCGTPWAVWAGDDTSSTVSQASPWNPAGIGDFSLTDKSGENVTKQTLQGREWVAGFIFTRCKGPCPTVVGQMKLLQKETGVTLVIFTVQPEVDTPEVLRSFSKAYVPEASPNATGQVPHWYWLTGDRPQIYSLIMKSFKMPVAQAGEDDVIHSNNLMHVDEDGRVLGKYNAMEAAEMALLRRIVQGKAPRGKMMGSSTPKPTGPQVEVEGAQAAGLTITRPDSEHAGGDESDPATDQPDNAVPAWIRSLPAVNASLNGLATILLLAGYVMIKSRRPTAHKVLMLSSFGTSIVFLACYLIYHFNVGSKKFPGEGAIKTVYLLILVTHIILAMAVPVLASMTIYRAWRGQWERHRSIARITFPIWVYVSVTGVIIYLMLYQWPAATP